MNPREWLGKQIREYHLTDIIGSGGMSAVFRAMHVKLQVERAVKVLRPDLTQDPQFVRRFEQEARILAVLEHPHLIRVFEFFEESGYLFIVMEIARGDSLEDLLLYHGVMPAKEMWMIISQAAQGLSYAHKKGIVHRDLSPDNIMVAGYDERQIQVKVIDFGIAKQEALDHESRKIMETGVTTTGSFIGKLRYCSPEHAMELPLDHRSDQYSLALIFMEAITGKPAFEGGSPITMLMRRVNEPPPRLTDLNPGSAWPTEVERVIDRALQSSPTERFPGILDFSEALGAALGIDAEKPPAEPPPDSSRRREQRDMKPRLMEPDEFLPDEEADQMILGITGLAETMDTTPDRTIYPGSDPAYSEPRYGRVQAPPAPRKIPWVRIVLGGIAALVVAAYFLLPPVYTDPVKGKLEAMWSVSMQYIDDLLAPEPTPSPTPVRVSPLESRLNKPAPSGGPYLATRPGVTRPRVIESEELKVPVHLKSEFPPPVTVVVEAVVLDSGQIVQEPVLIRSVEPILDRMALDAVKTWKFQPGTYNGRPADIITDVDVVFH
ncbi:MAG TPA: TonB family protein [bacterium]|nr:TonB family protein [bacterium]